MDDATTFSIDKGPRGWHVRVSGRGDWSHLMGVVRKVRDEAEETDCARVLFDTRGYAIRLNTLARYLLGSTAASEWNLRIEAAMLAASDQLDPERFGQQVAANRGLRLAIFDDDEAAALAWLGAEREVPKGPH